MIKSMTGFASRTHEVEQASIGVTVRSVNHRYLDVQVRLPQLVAQMESRVRALVQQRMARGRVEVSIAMQSRQVPTVEVELNEALVHAVRAAIDRARAAGLVEGRLEASDLLRLPQALTIRERSLDPESPEAVALEQGVEAARTYALIAPAAPHGPRQSRPPSRRGRLRNQGAGSRRRLGPRRRRNPDLLGPERTVHGKQHEKEDRRKNSRSAEKSPSRASTTSKHDSIHCCAPANI